MLKSYQLKNLYYAIRLCFKIVVTFGKKAFLIATPTHANLGDQAQLMCTQNWLKNNYPNHKLIKLPTGVASPSEAPYTNIFIPSLATTLVFNTIKLFITNKDLIIGHSGYFMTDHHPGWMMFALAVDKFPKNKILILPQTLKFYNPVIENRVSKLFNRHGNITLLCRDEVSYKRAKEIFTNCKLLLYPDIVTSLIGTKQYQKKRDGILFCMRNDLEGFYSKDQIIELRNKFSEIHTDLVDTTIRKTNKELEKDRQKIIYEMVEYFSTFKVIVTDRYHGTIFSAIAGTPVVVLSSVDHKLSSGVNWFPKDLFENYVCYAKTLDDAYLKINEFYNKKSISYEVAAYFKENFYDILKDKI